MTAALLLAPHIVLWLAIGDLRRWEATRTMIDQRWRGGGSVLVSAVSAWEIALLADTGRISLDCSPEAWVNRFVSRPGVETVPLTYRAASRAYGLQHFGRRDPADRLLVATAIELACELVTYDGAITDYALGQGRQSGLRVAA